MLVRENIDFVRGEGPITSMKIGLEKAIALDLQKVEKLDTEKLLDSIYIDNKYPFFYVYVNTSNPNFQKFSGIEEFRQSEIGKGKRKVLDYFQDLLLRSGLTQYSDFSDYKNVDEIVYEVKPEYQKYFKKIANEFNI